MRVAILGCGPTGLLAAHACYLEGVEFTVFSKKRKSQLFGSQYLHEPVPQITHPLDYGVNVTYTTLGSPVEYRRKVHGKAWDGVIHPDDFQPNHKAWDIRQAYEVLWRQYGAEVIDYEIPDVQYGAPEWRRFDRISKDLVLRGYDLVVSTVPRTLWQVNGEKFIFSKGWAIGDAPEMGKFCPFTTDNDNEIICNGLPDAPWSRLSRVYGYTSIEWPYDSPEPPVAGAALVTRPLRYVPNPSSRNPTSDWLHVGRYGKWEKGVVVTDAFHTVQAKLQHMKAEAK